MRPGGGGAGGVLERAQLVGGARPGIAIGGGAIHRDRALALAEGGQDVAEILGGVGVVGRVAQRQLVEADRVAQGAAMLRQVAEPVVDEREVVGALDHGAERLVGALDLAVDEEELAAQKLVGRQRRARRPPRS